MLSAQAIANYILVRSSQDDDPVSNLKLQKLLYYCQGFHLAFFDEPLFGEAIYKWTHGPVVPEIYHAYKDYGANPIIPPEDMDLNDYDEKTRELLEEVYSVYGQFSAFGLRNMTHQEPPWSDAIDGQEISIDSMRNYFKTRIQ